MTGIVVSAVCFLLGAAIIAGVVAAIRHKLRSFSQAFLGTTDIIDGFMELAAEEQNNPKSLNAMTSLYLPKIKKDFPEFSYDEMKVRAQNVLTSYLTSVSNESETYLSEGAPELHEKLVGIIRGLQGEGRQVRYDSVKLHRTEISEYKKTAGRCVITFQIACQYVLSMTEPRKTVQARYDVDAIYVQDRAKVENPLDFDLGTNCPNCGAPLEGIGAKICQYCGTPLREVNIYIWSFSDVRENM